ncbi:hypothetical protein, partial [Rossellomorea aquimaris]
NSHYTGFGEVLYFLVILPLEPQGLRVMKLIQLYEYFIFWELLYDIIKRVISAYLLNGYLEV